MKRPNIVFLLTDDQRFDTIAALGNSQIKTPNMDALVCGGTSFDRAFIPGGTCPAVCMPSRAMIHTGRTLFHIDADGETISPSHILLGEHLRNNGYDTYGIGKWHNGPESFTRSFVGGAEIFFGGMWDHWNVPAYSYQTDGRYDRQVPYVADAFHSREVTMVRMDHINPGAHSTDLFTDAACKWLTQRSDDRPFFLNVAYMAPHDPRTMPREFLDQYTPGHIDLPAAFRPEYEFDYGVSGIRDEVLASYPRTPDEVRKHIAEYYGMITHLDDSIGKVLDVLRSTGQWENTIVVLAGDNGLAIGQHGLFGKQSAYDHSVRIPLVFHGQGIPADQRVRDKCHLSDIFPTLCDLVGLPIPNSVEGRTLFPAARGECIMIEDAYLYLAYGTLIRAVRGDQYKLIEYAGDNGRHTQLFDLIDDPHELRNLAGNPASTSILKDLRWELFRLRDETGDLLHPTGKVFWEAYENSQ